MTTDLAEMTPAQLWARFKVKAELVDKLREAVLTDKSYAAALELQRAQQELAEVRAQFARPHAVT